MITTRMVGIVVSVFGFGIEGARAHAQPQSDVAGREWIREHAVAFRSSEPGRGFDDLAGLDAIIGDARIVSLGEPTHGTREAFQFKHRLLEYLVEKKGFSIFAIEANLPESFALNDYVIDGKGDPKALIAGMYFWTWRTEEVLAMVEWMRAWNAANPPETGRPRLQFTGFDMQFPQVAWKTAHDFAREHAPDLATEHERLLSDITAAASRQGQGGPGGWTTATGSFPVADARGKKLRFSAWIRTEGVTGWAGAWWRNDTPGGVNGFNNMSEKGIKGTTEWTRHEFSFDIPADTTNINFGFILHGGGTAWFDDVEVELDGLKYQNDMLFSFDFENDAVRYLSEGVSPEYAIARVETKPRSGRKSLEIRRKPEEEIPKIDPRDVADRADAFAEGLASRRADLIAKVGPKPAEWALRNARVVAQAAAMFASRDAFNARDESMAQNVRWILDQNPGQKIVLWAHNGHVARGEYMSMIPMGRHLSKAFGPDMVVVGFATGSGQYTAMVGGALRADNSLGEPPADSVESLFASSGLDRAIVDLRPATFENPGTRWAVTPRPMRSIGALATDQQFFTTIVKDNYDVLVWQRETTAARTLN